MSGRAITGASRVMTGTQDTELIQINAAFYADRETRHALDTLLSHGWRHFGERFQRYSLNFYKVEIRRVSRRRVWLSDFGFSKSQRRFLRLFAVVRVVFVPA